MKSLIVTAITISTVVIFTGCAGNQTFNPSCAVSAMTQDNASDQLTAVTPYGQMQITRTVSQADSMTPIQPLTASEYAADTNDFLGSIILKVAHDPASVDATWSGVGGQFSFHRSMPPTALGTNAVLNTTNTTTANAVVTQTTTVKTK